MSAGDVAKIDDEGRLYIVDRKRDMLISGGVNIFPVDVELAVELHPSVHAAAAVGVPDPQWGEALHDTDLADAIVDRTLERGRLLILDGPSRRTRQLDLDTEPHHAAN